MIRRPLPDIFDAVMTLAMVSLALVLICAAIAGALDVIDSAVRVLK